MRLAGARTRRSWLAALAAILLSSPAAAGEPPRPTDANLVTALDVSDSIMRHEEWLEFEGLAKAVTSAAFLDAIAGGAHGRIGFAVFAWSSGGRPAPLVPWTTIATVHDARRLATSLRSAAEIDRSAWARRTNGSDLSAAPERRTDLSAALDLALDLLLRAPYPAPRGVINLCANGADNVGSGPHAARARAAAAGAVVNALAIGRRTGLADYLRQEVQVGPGSFVTEVLAPEQLAAALIEKLLRDLTAAGPRRPLAAPAT